MQASTEVLQAMKEEFQNEDDQVTDNDNPQVTQLCLETSVSQYGWSSFQNYQQGMSSIFDKI